MVKMRRGWRWLGLLSGAGVLLQAGTCQLTSAEFLDQFVLPQVGSVVADTVFFFLDNALVHLTT